MDLRRPSFRLAPRVSQESDDAPANGRALSCIQHDRGRLSMQAPPQPPAVGPAQCEPEKESDRVSTRVDRYSTFSHPSQRDRSQRRSSPVRARFSLEPAAPCVCGAWVSPRPPAAVGRPRRSGRPRGRRGPPRRRGRDRRRRSGGSRRAGTGRSAPCRLRAGRRAR